MNEQNVVEVIVVPEVPKVIADEEIYVYVPIATNGTKGIASFDANSINVVAGVASVKDSYVNSLIDVKVQALDDELSAEIQQLQINKLDKLVTDGQYAYIHNGEVQTEIPVSENAPEAIVVRTFRGEILVGDNPHNQNAAISAKFFETHTKPIVDTLNERTEVYFTKDAQGYVYMNEAGGND